MPEEMTTSDNPSTIERHSSHQAPNLGLARFEGDAVQGFRENFTNADLKEVEQLAQQVITKHFPKLLSERDELVQESLKNFINLGLKNYSPEKGELIGYLYTIMRNAGIKMLQKQDKTPMLGAIDDLSEMRGPLFSTLGDNVKGTRSVPEQLAEKEWREKEKELLKIAIPEQQLHSLPRDTVLPQEVHAFIWSRLTKHPLSSLEETLISQATRLASSEHTQVQYLQEAVAHGLISISVASRSLLVDVSINKLPYSEVAEKYRHESESPRKMIKMRIFRARRKVVTEAVEYLASLEAETTHS